MSVEEARPLMNHAHAYQEQEMQPAGTGPIDVLASGEAGSGAPPIRLSIEISSDLMANLEREFQTRNREMNPGITFDAFVRVIIDVGLERLLQLSPEEALALVEREEEEG